jgi:hypothetical protein
MVLPYRQVPSDEDEEVRGGEEEKPFLSDDDNTSNACATLRLSFFWQHQILILRCLLLASCAVNVALIGVYGYSRTLTGPWSPIFPQALYCTCSSVLVGAHR